MFKKTSVKNLDELVSVIQKTEHETAIDWYQQQLQRVQEAKLEANTHLDDGAEESSGRLNLVKLSLSKSSTMVRYFQAAEIQAKITSAEIKAKQLALE